MSASDLYAVEGRDRPTTRIGRGLRVVGTLVSGLLNAGTSAAPSLSDIVLVRRADGAELRRWSPGFVDDFEDRMSEIQQDLDELDAVEFAERWFTRD